MCILSVNYSRCTFILKINPDGIVKIADLGLTKDKANILGTVCGTPLYMAPEVLAGQMYSEKADMFSYGMILWELWYGEDGMDEYKVSTA